VPHPRHWGAFGKLLESSVLLMEWTAGVANLLTADSSALQEAQQMRSLVFVRLALRIRVGRASTSTLAEGSTLILPAPGGHYNSCKIG
jgi:hypothetical protein